MAPADLQDPPTTTDDELAALRGRRADGSQRPGSPEWDADLEAQRAALSDPDRSLEDLESNGGLAEEGDGQMALVVGSENGKEVTLGTLVKRGTPIEVKFKMEGKAISGSGGLLGFASPNILLLVPARSGQVVTDPTYGLNDEGEEVVKKATLRQHIRPTNVLNANTAEARALMFGSGTLIAQLVAAARADGTSDANIRAAVINELDAALADEVTPD